MGRRGLLRACSHSACTKIARSMLNDTAVRLHPVASSAIEGKEEPTHHNINSTTTATTMPQDRLVTNTTTSGTNIQVWTIYSRHDLPHPVRGRPAIPFVASCLVVWSRPDVPNRLQILPAKLILG